MSATRERRNGRTRGACGGKRYDVRYRNVRTCRMLLPFPVLRVSHGSQKIQIRHQTASRQGSRERDTTAAKCKSLLRVSATQIKRYEASKVTAARLKFMKQVKRV